MSQPIDEEISMSFFDARFKTFNQVVEADQPSEGVEASGVNIDEEE